MNETYEAVETLISAVKLAHEKGGIYSLEDCHLIYMAITHLESISKAPDNAPSFKGPDIKTTN